MPEVKNKVFEQSSVPKAVFFNTVPAICSMIMVMIYNLADTFFVGRTGDPYMVAAVSYALPIFMIPSAIGNLVNIILDPIFIFTLGMGITGAAVATAIGNIIGALYYILYFVLHKSSLSISLKNYSVKNKIIGSVSMIGIPAALTSILMSVSNIVVNGKISAYGDLVVAGYGVNLKIHMILSYVVIGLGQGIQPLLGYCYGAGLKERYSKIMRFSIIYALIVSTALTGVCILSAKPLVGLFLENKAAFDYGVHFTVISLLSGPICGVLYVLLNALQARGAATESFIVSVSRQGFIFFPLLFLLHHLIGVDGLVWTQQFSDLLSFLLAIILYITVCKKSEVKKQW